MMCYKLPIISIYLSVYLSLYLSVCLSSLDLPICQSIVWHKHTDTNTLTLPSLHLTSATDAPEFEFCIVTAKYIIECAAVKPQLAEVRCCTVLYCDVM